MSAAKLVLSYCIGRPTAAVDPDSLDVQEVRHYQDQAIDPAALGTVLRGVPAETACFLMEVGVGAVGQKIEKQFYEQFQERFPGELEAAAEPGQDETVGPQPEAGKAKAAEQEKPASGKSGRGEQEKRGKRPAAREPELLPLEEILNAPRTVLAELGLPVPPLTATDYKRDFPERQCANEARSAPVLPRPGGREGAASGGDLD
jgi:hypothetical protein